MIIKYKWQEQLLDKYGKLNTVDLIELLAEMALMPMFPQNHRDEWEWNLLKSLLKERAGGEVK
jgi:hypothetical protein